MTDTTGWKLLLSQYSKEIRGMRYFVKRCERNGTPYYHVWCSSWSTLYCRLADAKRAAHRHADQNH